MQKSADKTLPDTKTNKKLILRAANHLMMPSSCSAPERNGGQGDTNNQNGNRAERRANQNTRGHSPAAQALSDELGAFPNTLVSPPFPNISAQFGQNSPFLSSSYENNRTPALQSSQQQQQAIAAANAELANIILQALVLIESQGRAPDALQQLSSGDINDNFEEGCRPISSDTFPKQ